jgi:hypothetical protein
MESSRREFVTRGAAAALLAGAPAGWVGGAWASDAPEHPRVRIGIIALTDCSSTVMAHELGLFKKHGIESTISREASWAVIRDRLIPPPPMVANMKVGKVDGYCVGGPWNARAIADGIGARRSRPASGRTSSRTGRGWPRSSPGPSTSTPPGRSSSAGGSASTTTATGGRRRIATP